MAPSAVSVHIVGAVTSSSSSAAVYLYSSNGIDFSVPTFPVGTKHRRSVAGNRSGLLLAHGTTPAPATLWVPGVSPEWVDDGWVQGNFTTKRGSAVGEDGVAWSVRSTIADPNALYRRSVGGVWSDVTAGVPSGTLIMTAACAGPTDDTCWITAWHVSTGICAKLVRWKAGSWAEVFVSNTEFDDVPYGSPYHLLGAYLHSWFGIHTMVHPSDPAEEVIWVCGERDTKPVVCRWDGLSGVFSKEWESVTSGQMNSIWARADDDVYAVGNAGWVMHYDGVDWTNISPGGAVTQNLNAIDGNAEGIWVCGDSGRLLSYDGSWTTLTSGSSYPLYDLWVYVPNVIPPVEVDDSIANIDESVVVLVQREISYLLKVFVVDHDIVRVFISDAVDVTPTYYAAGSFQILDSIGNEIPIERIRRARENPTNVIELYSAGLIDGENYTISVGRFLLHATNGAFVRQTKIPWTHVVSKVEMTKASLASLYDMSLEGYFRTLVQAIMVSDEEIGGNQVNRIIEAPGLAE